MRQLIAQGCNNWKTNFFIAAPPDYQVQEIAISIDITHNWDSNRHILIRNQEDKNVYNSPEIFFCSSVLLSPIICLFCTFVLLSSYICLLCSSVLLSPVISLFCSSVEKYVKTSSGWGQTKLLLLRTGCPWSRTLGRHLLLWGWRWARDIHRDISSSRR